MKKIITVFVYVCLSTSLNAQSSFQKYVGSDLYNGECIAASADAIYILRREYPSTSSPILTKMDLSGNILWAKELSFPSIVIGIYRIAIFDNSLLISGGHQNVGYKNFICKTDTAGNIVWTTELDYADINLNTRIHKNANGYLLVGHRDYAGGAGSFTFDITLAQIDLSGNLMWGSVYGDVFYDFLSTASVVDSLGNLYTAGTYGLSSGVAPYLLLSKFDLYGNLLWMKYFEDSTGFFTSYQSKDLILAQGGDLILTGTTYNVNFSNDVQLMRIDTTGTIVWAKRLYQISWNEYGKAVTSLPNGDILIGGNFYMGNVFGCYLAKFNLSGNLISSSVINNSGANPNGWVMTSYLPSGQDLINIPGSGLFFSTVTSSGTGNYRQTIIKTDTDFLSSCAGIGGNYPFTVNNTLWTSTSIIPLPNNIPFNTSVPVNFTSMNITEQSGDVCNLLTTSVNTVLDKSFTVFPVPAIDHVNFTFENSENTAIEITITDLTGRVINVDSEKITSNFNYTIQIDVKNFPQGVYLALIKKNGETAVKKFSKL